MEGRGEERESNDYIMSTRENIGFSKGEESLGTQPNLKVAKSTLQKGDEVDMLLDTMHPGNTCMHCFCLFRFFLFNPSK